MTTLNRTVRRAAGRCAIVLSIPMLFMASRAQAQTNITSCPWTISVPGNYQVTQNLVCPSGDGITINTHTTANASGQVSLKLNGKTITADSTSSGVAIHVAPSSGRSDHVTITGPGLITSNGSKVFTVGVEIDNTDYAQVSQVTVVGSANFGILASQDTFLLAASNLVGRTLGTLAGSGAGISCSLCGSSTITGNDSSGNVTGIDLDGEYTTGRPNANPNQVSNNVVNVNSYAGISLTNFFPATVRLYSNVANLNGQYGIHVSSAATPAIIFNNSAAGNLLWDLGDDNVGPPACQGVTWSGNVFFSGSLSCIH